MDKQGSPDGGRLSADKRALLEYLLAEEGIEGTRPQRIPRREKRSELSLSFSQQRLWVLHQLEPDSSAYNEPTAMRLVGPLNVEALQQSIQAIVQRHDSLRTVFTAVEGQPVQVIRDAVRVSVPVAELPVLPETEREAQVRTLTLDLFKHPFDLSQGPLFRVKLLRLADTEHMLLLAMHHIISDGWSVGVFFKELAALYEAYTTGRAAPLPELPIQYADFAHWQRKQLQGEVLASHLTYWKQQLTGSLPVLELPTDRPHPPIQTFRGARHYFALPTTVAEDLKDLSHQEGATLFMTLLAAFQTLLHRYTGQEDIILGSPIAGRDRPEVEGLIGCFLNTLVLRADLSGNPSFRELLSQVRNVALGAYAHQDVPFEQLVETLQPERDLSRNPLFQTMFVLQNSVSLDLPGLVVSPLYPDRGAAPFDLILSMEETAQGLGGWWEYNTDLFDTSTIARMDRHFQTLLNGLVVHPGQPLSDLPMLTATEQQQVLVEWNDTRADYPNEVCLHHLLTAQAARTPDDLAVVFDHAGLTYQELHRRANQLAHYLQSLGVGPDVLVGLCVERSFDMVIGILGILKAGGAYVPLDPGYPEERIAFMIEDAHASVLLTQQRLVPGLPDHGAHTVCLDTDWESIATESALEPDSEVTAGNLAYVIYTSGSTGQPKGVMILHRAICNHMLWMQERFSLNTADRVVQKTPFSFDASVWEFFAPLLVGGQLIVAQPEGHLDSAYLTQLMANEQVTILQLVPSLLQILLEEPALETCTSLRIVFCGGEALTAALSERLQARLAVDVHNLYGPTEATIDATSWRYETESSQPFVPIGRPIANTQIYLLDTHLQPVPIGSPGELHIGGAGLARGYLDRPELTDEKFIPHPFNTTPGARLYKTGDLARYRSDGTIEFLGRIDHQVKLRGFRIELEEIEAALGRHPAVRDAVAVVREDAPGDKRLVAYLVVNQDLAPTIDDLRHALQETLPAYMVPAMFIFLETLPLTPNGKVDRRALPAPDQSRPVLQETFVAPRTPSEALLVDIWSQVLGVDQVGIHDNFFALGGDSILSIQIIARANQANVRLLPKQMFQHQTVAELAAAAGTTLAVQAEQGLVTGPLPLTPIQHWFFEQQLADPHHWNMALLLEVRRRLDPLVLEQVIRQLLVHHDALRLRFTRLASGWQQENTASEEAVPVTRVDLSSWPERDPEATLQQTAAELQASFNWAAGPLLRVALFDLGRQQPQRLLLIIHHLVVDGVSWRILLEDLHIAYQQCCRGEPMQLPSKTASFQQWSERLTAHARSLALQSELPYWLAASRARSRLLPVDFAAASNTVASARTVSVSLSAEETRVLLQDVPQVYHTQINDVLLTALLQTFSRWTGERSLLVDLEGHGREDIFDDDNVDVSRTVGWFTTIFPILLEREDTTDIGDFLKSMKEQLRRIPNRGIGYGLLRYLSDETAIIEQLASLPQAEVSFNYLGQYDQLVPDAAGYSLMRASIGPTRSPRGSRRHLIAIDGLVVDGRLRTDWDYSENVHRQATVESLAQGLVEALREIITHCSAPETGGYTPSDFPDIKLNQAELDKFIDSIT